MKLPFPATFGVLTTALWALMGFPSPAAEENPNILLILVDDMGYGDPGCYNPDSKIPTPNIDALARDGMRFTDVHAPGPLCHMSRYGLMTGRYPFRTDVSRWPTHALIEKDQTTIASLLKTRGYHTAMVGKWHLGFEEKGYDKPLPGGPVEVGFDSFFGLRASTDIPPYFYIRDRSAVSPPTEEIAANRSDGWSPIQGAFWRAGGIAPDLELGDVLPRFAEEAINVIKDHAATRAPQPLMLYLAFPAPHTPWLPAPEFAGKSGAGLYGDFVVMVDAMIGRVLGELAKAGMADDTLVVFTSDNGPVWYEADVTRFGHDASGGLRGMKADAWEGGHRMPFIVRWPGHTKPESVSDQTLCFTDLLATFATITGYARENDEGQDSYDFSKVLLGTHPADEPVRPHLAMQSGGGFMTVREGNWKLIEGLGSGGFSEPKKLRPKPGASGSQLFDMQSDPGETTDVIADHPEIVEKLRALLKGITAAAPPKTDRVPAAKVLFLGNSITLHPPAPELGWTGHWGMAASAEANDYVHLLIADLAQATGKTPEVMVRNIADFERAFEAYDIAAELKDEWAFEAEIVVVAIGENVDELTTEEARANFSTALARLLAEIKQHGDPTLFVRSSFWPNPVKDGILRARSDEAGAVFVDIGALGGDATNKAPAFKHAGVAAHPGEKGMRAVADALFHAMQTRTDPVIVFRGDTPSEGAPHGGGNVYAPEIHRDGTKWLMWYGGQGKDGHDRIHLADSDDGEAWKKRGVVLDCGTANHVNDPSVVRVGDIWWMFYTVAETAEEDEVAVATSPDGVTWEKHGVVLGRGAGTEWDSLKVGRPSVLHENGIFRMWYDGQPTSEAAASNPLAAEVKREGRAIGYAESRDGLTWERRPAPVFRESAGAIHVSHHNDRYLMLIESSAGVRRAESRDGFTWQSRGLLFPVSGGETDRFGCVTPFLFTAPGRSILFFGAAGRKTWDGNAIASVPILRPD